MGGTQQTEEHWWTAGRQRDDCLSGHCRFLPGFRDAIVMDPPNGKVACVLPAQQAEYKTKPGVVRNLDELEVDVRLFCDLGPQAACAL